MYRCLSFEFDIDLQFKQTQLLDHFSFLWYCCCLYCLCSLRTKARLSIELPETILCVVTFENHRAHRLWITACSDAHSMYGKLSNSSIGCLEIPYSLCVYIIFFFKKKISAEKQAPESHEVSWTINMIYTSWKMICVLQRSILLYSKTTNTTCQHAILKLDSTIHY